MDSHLTRSGRRSRRIPRPSFPYGSVGTESGPSSSLPRETDVRNPMAQPAAGTGTDEPIAVWLTDSGVLDCCICLEPLSIPVFQCANGHTTCSSCCVKIHNKCPSCQLPISIRNRAVEKILESATKACRNQKVGCKEKIRYHEKNEHEAACKYNPCTCPFSGCSLVSAYQQLLPHFTAQHPCPVLRFKFNDYIRIKNNVGAGSLLLPEKKGNYMFVLHRREESLGSVIWVSCVSPDSLKKIELFFLASGEEGSERLTRNTVIMPSRGRADDGDGHPAKGIILVPSYFLSRSSYFSLKFSLKE